MGSETAATAPCQRALHLLDVPEQGGFAEPGSRRAEVISGARAGRMAGSVRVSFETPSLRRDGAPPPARLDLPAIQHPQLGSMPQDVCVLSDLVRAARGWVRSHPAARAGAQRPFRGDVGRVGRAVGCVGRPCWMLGVSAVRLGDGTVPSCRNSGRGKASVLCAREGSEQHPAGE